MAKKIKEKVMALLISIGACIYTFIGFGFIPIMVKEKSSSN